MTTLLFDTATKIGIKHASTSYNNKEPVTRVNDGRLFVAVYVDQDIYEDVVTTRLQSKFGEGVRFKRKAFYIAETLGDLNYDAIQVPSEEVGMLVVLWLGSGTQIIN